MEHFMRIKDEKVWMKGWEIREKIETKRLGDSQWWEPLGSGARNIYKYNKIYSGAEPIFIEGDVLKTIIPLTIQASTQASTQAETKEQDRNREILEQAQIKSIIVISKANHQVRQRPPT